MCPQTVTLALSRATVAAPVRTIVVGLALVLAACNEPVTPPSAPSRGPYRLEGNVWDGDFRVAAVEVDVIEGIGRGLETLTNATGAFTFDGLQGPTQIRFRKQGYPDQIEQVDVTASTRRSFELSRNVPRPDYTGTYSLTISAAASCAAAIPQRRVYVATITQSPNAGTISVSLSGANFAPGGNQFAGAVDPSGGIAFALGPTDIFSDPYVGDVEERVAAGVLAINGIAITTGSPERISGGLAGTLGIVAESGGGPRSYLAECKSDAHAFEMVRHEGAASARRSASLDRGHPAADRSRLSAAGEKPISPLARRITLDTMQADRVPMYGFTNVRTPALARTARDSRERRTTQVRSPTRGLLGVNLTRAWLKAGSTPRTGSVTSTKRQSPLGVRRAHETPLSLTSEWHLAKREDARRRIGCKSMSSC